eukprot:GFYU01009904.1.p1 GENE.GFYU01009904.1~~GFYU01009904.1.p1  ORF type:complete len:306 (-),score=125.12 GFYU01009904.1:351-1220(-)
MGRSKSEKSYADYDNIKDLLKDRPIDWNPRYPEVTSRVINVTDETTWWEKGFLVPHEPIRKELRIVREMFKDGHLDFKEFPWKIEWFFSYVKKFFGSVHHHHDAEEKIFFPELEKVGKIPPSDRVADDHRELLQMLDTFLAYEDKLKTASGKKITDLNKEMEEKWIALENHMSDHLAEEEFEYGPQIGKVLTHKQMDNIVKKIIKSLGLGDGATYMAPWLYAVAKDDWADEEYANREFPNNMPPPIRSLFWNKWVPRYAANFVYVRDSLYQEEEPEVLVPQTGCACTIL